MRARLGKPTKLGYAVFGILAIIVIGIVVGVLIGGGTGGTIDAVGGFLIVVFIFLMVGNNLTPRPPGKIRATTTSSPLARPDSTERRPLPRRVTHPLERERRAA